MQETVDVTAADGVMGVRVVRPDGDGPFPVVVFFHHGPGLDEPSEATMQLIADRGYYVVSHDRYHRAGRWLTMTPAMRKDPEQLQRFWGLLFGTTEEMVDRDVAALLEHVDGDPAAASEGTLRCIGYCIGARSVVCTMAWRRDRFGVGVALHPSACTTDEPDSPHLLVADITGSMYVAFGAEDAMQAPGDNLPFIDAVNAMPGGRGTAVVHDGADHGFAVIGSPNHHEGAAAASYEEAFRLFAG